MLFPKVLKKGMNLFLPALIMGASFGVNAADNVVITGNLVTEPCTLDPESAEVILDFGNVVSKYFYSNSRTPGETFSISLTECDLDIGKNVSFKFSGTESSLLGLLAPDGKENGLAIGIESADGLLAIPLGQETPLFELSEGTTRLTFKGYIAAKPDAIKDKTIVAGEFTATAVFEIIYP